MPNRARLLMPIVLSLAACQPGPFASLEDPGPYAANSSEASGEKGGAHCPDWREAQLEHPLDALLGNPAPVARLRFGCSQLVNLQRMVADPDDLRSAGSTGAATSIGATSAVQRYNSNQVTPLPEPALHLLRPGG